MALPTFAAESPAEVKACCATAYETPWAKMLMGDTFHPGGLPLTLHLGDLLGLTRDTRLLDVACGRGTSAIALAKEFGCTVVGVDLGEESIRAAREAARAEGLEGRVSFRSGDAEALPVDDSSFDAIICECAFCTFPSKESAAAEFARVLRPGGALGVSDITREGPLPPELETLLGWVACLADARPLADYEAIFSGAGLLAVRSERHDETVGDLARSVKFRLLGAEVLAKLGKGPVPLEEVLEAKRIVKAAAATAKDGRLGYAVIVGTTPGE
ncbi:MAG: class I SAM-dependent methyltransferase [Dehalococcoidia bacterium]